MFEEISMNKEKIDIKDKTLRSYDEMCLGLC